MESSFLGLVCHCSVLYPGLQWIPAREEVGVKWGYGGRGADVVALLQVLRVLQRGQVHPHCQMPYVLGGLLRLPSEEGGSTGELGSHPRYVPGEEGPVMMCKKGV